jgi:membrane-associated protein
VSDFIAKLLDLPVWLAVALVFLLPAAEASIFLGFVVPGEIAVVLGGVLAFQGSAPLAAVLIAAIAGAIIGDSIGYYVGKRWGRRMLDSTVGRFVKAEHLDRGEEFLAARGGRAVFFGRWTASLRAVIPGLAGMSRMHYRTFLIWNAIGGAVWATTFVLLGHAAGNGWRELEHHAHVATLAFSCVITITLIALFVRYRLRLTKIAEAEDETVH